MKLNLVFLISAVVILFIIWRWSCMEGFWDGGYSRQAYLGQPFIKYGRTAFIASTDNPKMLIDKDAQPINPPYCGPCHSYDPDVMYNKY